MNHQINILKSTETDDEMLRHKQNMQIETNSCLQSTKSPVRMGGEVVIVPGTSNQSILPEFDGFLDTGRTGRRNAIADIHLDQSATVSTADLPLDFVKLSCSNS